MHFSLAIASAILASTAIASQDFARRDPYADTEALISQNAHLYARDAYASAYADAYHELSARWAAPEPYLDEPYFEERDLEEHYLEARDLEEYYLEKRVGPEEQRNARLREAGHHIADAIPQTPVKSPIITIGQKVAKVTGMLVLAASFPFSDFSVHRSIG
ncbi:hypothetical protein MMC17_003676 [Xylographa soralifera]|nr:hypothetical protein [Xylographa soralifera]